jgi:ABC-type multidrug transport system ATPase subunit
MEASITFKGIGKKFQNKTILAGLNFGVEKGKNFVIVGESGAGKSTMLKILIGIVKIDAGIAYVNGKDITSRGPETRSIIGYMPQISDLDKELTIIDQLIIDAQLHDVDEKKATKSIMNWAEVLDFTQFLSKYPEQLSFGHQRIICFARALIHNPEVILLDEPTTGMDPHSRAKIWDTLDRLQTNKTILFTTQNFSEAERYAERIAILHEGNIKMNGTLDKLIETTQGLTRYRITFSTEPSSEFMKEFSQVPGIVRPKKKGDEVEFYSRDRKRFFRALEVAMKYELEDIDTTLCRLQDLFVGLTDGGLE